MYKTHLISNGSEKISSTSHAPYKRYLYIAHFFDNAEKQNTSSCTHPDKTRAQHLCECVFAAVMRYWSVTAYLQCGINQLLWMLSPWSEVESIIQTTTGVMTRNFCL